MSGYYQLITENIACVPTSFVENARANPRFIIINTIRCYDDNHSRRNNDILIGL